MRARYPDAKLVGVAHSIGSLIIGGAPNVSEFARLVFIAAHTGYYGDYARRQPHSDGHSLAWRHAGPDASVRLFSGQQAGVGRRHSGRAWRCNGRHAGHRNASRGHGPATPRVRAQCLGVSAKSSLPSLAISFADDKFATEAGLDGCSLYIRVLRRDTNASKPSIGRTAKTSDTLAFSAAKPKKVCGHWCSPICGRVAVTTAWPFGSRLTSLANGHTFPLHGDTTEASTLVWHDPCCSRCCCPGPAVPPSGTREVGTGQRFYILNCAQDMLAFWSRIACRWASIGCSLVMLPRTRPSMWPRMRNIHEKWLNRTGVECKSRAF